MKTIFKGEFEILDSAGSIRVLYSYNMVNSHMKRGVNVY